LRRITLISCMILIFSVAGALTVLSQAQDDPTATPQPESTLDAQAVLNEIQILATEVQLDADNTIVTGDQVERAAEAANRSAVQASEAVSDAQGAIDLASNMFGLFEAMSGAVGLVVPFLAIAAGLIGFRRLESAQNELKEARERFEREMRGREEQFDKLRVELEESVQRQRDNAANASLALSLLPLGERQYRAQDYQGALDTYHRALALDRENPIIHYRIGYVYTQSGELEKAKDQMERSLKLDPALAPSRAAMGYIYRRVGDKLKQGTERDIVYNLAEQNFLQALKDSPRLMDEDGEAWWGALGGLYRRRGQTEQAIYAYERGTEVTPQSSYPFSNLALLYAETHNRERMLETYKRVERLAFGEVQSDTTNYWAYADLITSRMAMGKIESAWDILDAALETAPAESPYTLEMLIDTLNRLKGALTEEEIPEIDKVIAYIKQFQKKREERRNRQTQEIEALQTTESIEEAEKLMDTGGTSDVEDDDTDTETDA